MRRKIRFFVAIFFYYAGVLHIKRFFNNVTGRRLTVLTFHRVTGPAENTGLPTITVSTENFELLIRFLKKNYKSISLQDCIDHVRNGIQFPANSLLVTFDDGYRNVLENGAPLLSKYGLPFVIFLPTAVIDQDGSFWWDRVYDQLSQPSDKKTFADNRVDPLISPFLQKVEKILSFNPDAREPAILDFIEGLQDCNAEIRERVLTQLFAIDGTLYSSRTGTTVVSWQQLQEFDGSDVDFGSHTVTHQFLTSVSNQETMVELIDSKKQLEQRLERPIESFSYPGGRYTEETSKSVAAAGYSCAFTADEGLNSLKTDRYKLRRINISDDNVTTAAGKFSNAIAAWFLFLK